MKNKLFLCTLIFIIFNMHVYSHLAPYLGSEINYSYFNNQNQFVVSLNKTAWEFFPINDFAVHKISLGLRTFENDKIDIIYRIAVVNFNGLVPIINRDSTPRPLAPGSFTYSYWNNVFGLSVLDIDKTGIEDFYIKWFQLRGGFGINTYEDVRRDKLNFAGYALLKLGLSSITLGDYNFKSINNNMVHNLGAETGLNIMLNVTYTPKYSLKTYSDYSLFVSNEIFHKFCLGFSAENYISLRGDYLKLSAGIDYHKFLFKNKDSEFIRVLVGINYYFGNFATIVPEFLQPTEF